MKIDVQSKHIFLLILFIFLIAYSSYQARFLILGPRIWIDSPKDGYLSENSLVTIEGRAKNISWISLNDRQIFTDEKGAWSEKLIVSDGISIMAVKARDRLGRKTEKYLQIVRSTQTDLK